jgi:hypothetical protein
VQQWIHVCTCRLALVGAYHLTRIEIYQQHIYAGKQPQAQNHCISNVSTELYTSAEVDSDC